MYQYWIDFTLGQVSFKDEDEHEKHFLDDKLANDAKREKWRNLRVNIFSRLIIDAINRKSVGAYILIIGVKAKKMFLSILKEALPMAISHFKEQGNDVQFDLQLVLSSYFCPVILGLNQEELAKMDNAVMKSQVNLLSGVDYVSSSPVVFLGGACRRYRN
jgi:hypothetical protein